METPKTYFCNAVLTKSAYAPNTEHLYYRNLVTTIEKCTFTADTAENIFEHQKTCKYSVKKCNLCIYEGTPFELLIHTNECKFNACQLCYYFFKGTLSEVSEHQKTTCWGHTCKNSPICAFRGELIKVTEHSEKCTMIKCQFEKCTYKVSSAHTDHNKWLTDHESKCDYNPSTIKCKYCNQYILVIAVPAHDIECHNQVTVCEGCGLNVTRKDTVDKTHWCDNDEAERKVQMFNDMFGWHIFNNMIVKGCTIVNGNLNAEIADMDHCTKLKYLRIVFNEVINKVIVEETAEATE